MNHNLRIDLSQKDWYAFTDNYGTSEEKYLVKYIDKAYEQLKNKYSEIYPAESDVINRVHALFADFPDINIEKVEYLI